MYGNLSVALHGCESVVSFLLDNDHFSPDTPDSSGNTPLMDAIKSGHTDIADILISRQKAGILLSFFEVR